MSTPIPWLLGILPAHPSIPEVLEYQVTGLIVVFSALGSLWVLLEVLGRFFSRRAPAPAPARVRASAPPVAAIEASGPTPAVIAAISAAVHLALGGRAHRIASIQPTSVSAAWAAEGRRDIFSSHRVR